LRAYQRVLNEIRALGAELVAVSPELPDNSLTTAEKNELTFEVLSDLGNLVARTYGLVFQLPEDVIRVYREHFGNDLSVRNGDESWELPVPATFVIGRDGLVQLAFVDPDYKRRLEPAEILATLAQTGPS
jgi:peroxiredoxin